MKVLVTGASGWIGSALVPQLQAAGHDVVGLARSDDAAERVASSGAVVTRGALGDAASLRAAASGCDGVVHLAYHHDFAEMEAAAALDREAITAFADVLEGSGGPLLIASGTLGLDKDDVATEEDRPYAVAPRAAAADLALATATRGVRPAIVRLPPTVHGTGDHGFVATLVTVARSRGVAGYVGDGATRWSAVHRDDAARAFALAVDRAPAGAVLHAVAEEGVALRDVATVIAARLGVPAVSVAPEDAVEHFGWLGRFLVLDGAASSARTRALLGWAPTGPALLEDLERGAYFDER